MDEQQATTLKRGTLMRIMVATAALFASMAIVPPSTDLIVREAFGLGSDEVGAFFSVHSLPQLLLLGIMAGVLSDRLGKRLPLAILGGIGTGVTTMVLPHLPSFGSLLAWRFLDGILGIAALGMLMTKALELAQQGNRHKIIGIYMLSIPVGYLSGSFLIAVLGEEYYKVTFAIVGALVVLCSILLFMDLSSETEPLETQPSALAILETLKNRRLWYPMLFNSIDKFTFGFLVIIASLALKDVYHLSALVWGGSSLGLMWVGYLIGTYPSTLIGKAIGNWNTIAIGSFFYGSMLLLLVATDFPMVFVVALFFAGIFIAMQTIPTFGLIGQLSNDTNKGTVTGAFNLTGSFALIVGFVAAAKLEEKFGYLIAFSVAGGLEILAAFLAYQFGKWDAHHGAVDSTTVATETSPDVPRNNLTHQLNHQPRLYNHTGVRS